MLLRTVNSIYFYRPLHFPWLLVITRGYINESWESWESKESRLSKFEFLMKSIMNHGNQNVSNIQFDTTRRKPPFWSGFTGIIGVKAKGIDTAQSSDTQAGPFPARTSPFETSRSYTRDALGLALGSQLSTIIHLYLEGLTSILDVHPFLHYPRA